ncbi:MAG: hypothetical protein ACYCST_15930 [Acidimicrobiales bacterium]
MTPESEVDRTTGEDADIACSEMIVTAALAYSEMLREATRSYRQAISVAEERLETNAGDGGSMFDSVRAAAYEVYLEESRSAWRAYDAVRSAAAESCGGILQRR